MLALLISELNSKDKETLKLHKVKLNQINPLKLNWQVNLARITDERTVGLIKRKKTEGANLVMGKGKMK